MLSSQRLNKVMAEVGKNFHETAAKDMRENSLLVFFFAHTYYSSGKFSLSRNATPSGEGFWILSSDSVTLLDRGRVGTGLAYTEPESI